MTLKAPAHVSESNETEVEQLRQGEASEARIHLPEALASHRERDEAYPSVARLSDTARVVECKDGIQWILQRRSGDQWKGLAYCRTRAALIREACGLLGHVPEALFHHHDGFIEVVSRCGVCGRIATKPTGALPRHLFCLAVRKTASMTTTAANSMSAAVSDIHPMA